MNGIIQEINIYLQPELFLNVSMSLFHCNMQWSNRFLKACNLKSD
jgi:hypothetical protein